MDSFIKSHMPHNSTDENPAPSNATHTTSNENPQPSYSELLASAKVVAGALTGQQDCDKAKTAGAAADILNAASHYGKLDETTGIGKYVDQAEDYLHKFSSTTTTTTSNADGHKTTTTTTTHGETAHPSGGYGEYIKMAEGMLHKPSGDDKSHGQSSGAHGHSIGGETTHESAAAHQPDGGKHGQSGDGHSSSGSGAVGGHGQSEGGGYGDYMKMAGDFIKKH